MNAESEHERKLRAAARLAHVGYWEHDLTADRVSWSEDSCQVLGVPVTERTRSWKEFMALVHPDDRRLLAECRMRARRGEPTHRVAFRLIRGDGGITYAETVGEPIRNEANRTIRTVGAIQDVSERQHVAELLQRDRSRFELALHATGLGFWDWDRQTNLIEFWPAGKPLLGLRPDEIPSRYEDWLVRVHPDERDRLRAAARTCIDDGQSEFAVEFRMAHKDGTYRWIYTCGVLVRDETGRPTHLVGCHVNVTERKQLEQQVQQAQKMEAIGRLAAGIAHDFNNLLTVIGGNADLVAEALGRSHPSTADVHQIQAAAKSGATLTRQLLAFSRRQVLQPQVLDLAEVLRRLESMLRRVIGEDVPLTLNLPAHGRVKVDPGQIEQMILNLVVNARDAMPTGGLLAIETADVDLDQAYAADHPGARPGRHVLIAVSDTGAGMDEATRAHLFEPFFTTKPAGKGTGLGLATVYGIVTQSGGSIRVHSELGKGTTFKIYLPAVDGEATPTEPAGDPQAIRGTEMVLVVEDQPEVREFIQRTLTRYGYRVLVASNGPEAIAAARAYNGPLDALVTDVVLPGGSGRDVARQIVAERGSVRVLYMSGYTDGAIRQHGALDPRLAFIQKPFTGGELLRKIRGVLDGPPRLV